MRRHYGVGEFLKILAATLVDQKNTHMFNEPVKERSRTQQDLTDHQIQILCLVFLLLFYYPQL